MSADIFIIGSDSAVTDQLESVLKTVGYEVSAFADVEQALASLEADRPSLVFIDTASVGFELGEDIAQIQVVVPNVDFILVAEYQDPLIEQEALQHGVNSWLYRPFTPPEIILKVASVLESASQVGEDGVAEDEKEASEKKGQAERPEA